MEGGEKGILLYVVFNLQVDRLYQFYSQSLLFQDIDLGMRL